MKAIHCAVTVLLLTLGQHCISDSSPEYREECEVWRNVTQKLDKEANVEMSCNPNVQCTGYDCIGRYQYQGVFSLGNSFTLDYCYGMAIHPCDTPADMHFYIEFPDQNDTFQTTVSDSGHDMTYAIPGASYDISSAGSSQAFVVVDMNRTQINGRTYLELGLKVKVRVQGFGGFIETWPQGLQRTLMPDMLIPVPDCEKDVFTPRHTPHTCPTLSTTVAPPTTQLPPGVSTTTKKPVTGVTGVTTSTPRQTSPRPATCNLNEMGTCGHNEKCQAPVKQDGSVDAHSDVGICMCLANYKFVDSTCVSINPTGEPIYVIDPMPESSNKNVIIIACSVVAVVVIIAALLGFVVHKYYKHKQTYGQHAMLLTSDDDDPLDIGS